MRNSLLQQMSPQRLNRLLKNSLRRPESTSGTEQFAEKLRPGNSWAKAMTKNQPMSPSIQFQQWTVLQLGGRIVGRESRSLQRLKEAALGQTPRYPCTQTQ